MSACAVPGGPSAHRPERQPRVRLGDGRFILSLPGAKVSTTEVPEAARRAVGGVTGVWRFASAGGMSFFVARRRARGYCFFARENRPTGGTSSVCPTPGTFPSSKYPILFGVNWRTSPSGLSTSADALYGFAANEIRTVGFRDAQRMGIVSVARNVFVTRIRIQSPVVVSAYTADGALVYQEKVTTPPRGTS